jgi:hypothetical protein
MPRSESLGLRFGLQTLKCYADVHGGDHVDSFFHDLAGNAWCGPIMMAILIAIMRSLTEKHLCNFSCVDVPLSQTSSADSADALADILLL